MPVVTVVLKTSDQNKGILFIYLDLPTQKKRVTYELDGKIEPHFTNCSYQVRPINLLPTSNMSMDVAHQLSPFPPTFKPIVKVDICYQGARKRILTEFVVYSTIFNFYLDCFEEH